MTDDDYLASRDPRLRLRWFLHRNISDRKMRLFAVACCRHVWELLTDERSRTAVEVAERFADREAAKKEGKNKTTKRELMNAYTAASMALASERSLVSSGPTVSAAWAASEVADERAYWASKAATDNICCTSTNAAEEETMSLWMMSLLRDLFGNSNQPVSLDLAVLAWHDSTIPRIAQGIYEERQLPSGTFHPARMNILADALLDAGCDNEEIIQHCRSDTTHVRGCWVVDLLLGKL